MADFSLPTRIGFETTKRTKHILAFAPLRLLRLPVPENLSSRNPQRVDQFWEVGPKLAQVLISKIRIAKAAKNGRQRSWEPCTDCLPESRLHVQVPQAIVSGFRRSR